MRQIRSLLGRLLRCWGAARAEVTWRLKGCPAPAPPHIKQAILRSLAKSHGARILVQTGTFYGETLTALRRTFDELYSVELSHELYGRAAKRFAGDPKIHLRHGDSGRVLSEVLKRVDKPALFWLDGHYSGGPTALGDEVTPILRELRQIAQQSSYCQHLIVVDDARLFDGTDGYPTMQDLKAEAIRLGFTQIDVASDMILLKAAG
jgi:hypothetical protein